MNREDESDELLRIEASVNRPFYLPRLDRSAYRGHAVVHWTLTLEARSAGWLNPSFHAAFRELMLHAAAREGLFCPAYCMMPDHLHLVWMGLNPATDQRNAMAFLRTHLKRNIAPAQFQRQAHDHVLKEDERKQDTFAKACLYALKNPVRAGLVSDARDWEYLGAIIPGYPTLHPHDASYWRLFWELYWKNREGEK
ncbi:MAG: hypothetical protein K8R87_01575 [Verrucomicrobia bacterium]|nr:hypothetical protein [Verrucomicrobiota bacterium]